MDIVAEQLSDPHVLAVKNCPWNETINLLVKHFLHLHEQKLGCQSGAYISQEAMAPAGYE